LVDGATYTYSGVYTSVTGCNTETLNLTITPSTVYPEASAQTFSGSPTVADLVATGTNLQWYTAETGGTALATTTALATGTYYVSQTLTSCESTRTSVAVTLVPAWPVITYNASNTFTANSPIVSLTVTNTGGAVQSYSVSPALPTGIALNTDGSITGTPTVATAATDYVVTATNASGSSSYTLNIAITTALGVVKEMFSNAIVAYPNPYSDVFKIEAKTNSSDAITVSIYDMLAKKIESQKGTPTEIGTLQFGKDFPSGVYNVIVTQGTEVKILRVIKK
jgi:hypothetical protein